MGGVDSTSQQDRYALFSVSQHAEVRTMQRGWTIEQLIADVLGVQPRTRSIRILLEGTRDRGHLSCGMPW